jgi:hypothetical protein
MSKNPSIVSLLTHIVTGLYAFVKETLARKLSSQP